MSVGRLRALDWLRGIVMVLMAVDHASAIYNAGRVANDNAVMHVVGSALPPEQFFTRWITHLCAPAFVLLAGMSIALAGARQRGQEEGRAFDRHLAIRGLVLVGLDALYMSALGGGLLLQVLYALGMPIFDNLDLEAIAEAAAARNRWEFLFTAAPIRITGGTGSPLNPIATF